MTHLLLALLVPAAGGFAMPAYRLNVGEAVCYTTVVDVSTAAGERSRIERRREFSPLADSAGRWTILLQSEEVTFAIADDSSESVRRRRTGHGFFELGRDGSLGRNECDADDHPGFLFPPLPADTVAAKAGWGWFDTGRHESTQLRLNNKSVGDSEWNVKAGRSSARDAAYAVGYRCDMTFDRKRGLFTQRQSDGTMDVGFGPTRSLSVTRLDSAARFDVVAGRRMLASLAAYRAADARADSIIDVADEALDTSGVAFALAESVLAAAETAAAGGPGEELLRDERGRRARTAPLLLDGIRARARRIGRPAPLWTLADLEGKKHALKDSRGKVVVLDFWYRGCSWCMLAMPEMVRLSRELAGTPVQFFGMNTDEDTADARHVVRAYGISYPTLRCGDVPKEYGVSGFPTVVVVDGRGVVREMLVGYSPDIHDRLKRAIRNAWGED